MQIDPMVVAIGAVLCLIPVGFGILVANWRLPWIEREPLVRENPSVTELASELLWPRHEMRDEGDIACDCASCQFWSGRGFFQ